MPILSSAPSRNAPANRSITGVEIIRRLLWRALAHGSGNKINTRSRDAAGRRSNSWRASSRYSRILPRSSSRIFTSNLTTPLINGSQPINPMLGFFFACQARCSPPPKPISSHTFSVCTANRPGGEKSSEPVGRSISIDGKRFFNSVRWPVRSFRPCRRP